jgi:riboflavin synthase
VQNTALQVLAPGAQVNLEIDMIARYVERMLSAPALAAPVASKNGA